MGESYDSSDFDQTRTTLERLISTAEQEMTDVIKLIFEHVATLVHAALQTKITNYYRDEKRAKVDVSCSNDLPAAHTGRFVSLVYARRDQSIHRSRDSSAVIQRLRTSSVLSGGMCHTHQNIAMSPRTVTVAWATRFLWPGAEVIRRIGSLFRRCLPRRITSTWSTLWRSGDFPSDTTDTCTHHGRIADTLLSWSVSNTLAGTTVRPIEDDRLSSASFCLVWEFDHEWGHHFSCCTWNRQWPSHRHCSQSV